MTHKEQIEFDLKVYGVAFEKLTKKGKIKRLDPRNVKIIRPNVKPVHIETNELIKKYP